VNAASGSIVEAHTRAVRGPMIATIPAHNSFRIGRGGALHGYQSAALARLRHDKSERLARQMAQTTRNGENNV